MSVKDRIDIEFGRAMEQADELEELSGRICDIGSAGMDKALGMLTRSWKGENAGEYAARVNRLRDKMFGCAEVLKETSDLIRLTAQRIYAVEMAAINIVIR